MSRPWHPWVVIALLAVSWAAPVDAQAPSPTASMQAATLREDGRRAVETRRYREAVALLEQSAAMAPSVDTFFLLGRAYWGEDRPYPISAAKAITAFRRAVELDPDLTSSTARTGLEQLALAAVRNERLDEARSAYERLLVGESDPERVARFQTQIDEIDLDRGVYRPPLKTNYNARGEVLGPVGPRQMRTNQNFEKGRHTADPVRGEAHFRKAIETDPTMHQAYLNLAQALIQQRRYADAIPFLTEADRVWRINHPEGPPYVRAMVSLVTCHLELGHLDQAVEIQRALDAVPGQDNWEVLGAMRLRIETGRAAETIPVLEAGALDDPDNVAVLHALATAYAAVGRYADAVRQIRSALEAIPPDHPFLDRAVEPWRALERTWLSKIEG